MKTLIKTIAIGITFILLIINFSLAQTPPPPNGGGTPTPENNTPVGGGAPIGGGLIILMALGAGYGAKKVYSFRKAMPLAQKSKMAE